MNARIFITNARFFHEEGGSAFSVLTSRARIAIRATRKLAEMDLSVHTLAMLDASSRRLQSHPNQENQT